MPLAVPTYDNFQAMPTMGGPGYITPPSGDAPGEIRGRQLQGLGAALQETGARAGAVALDAQQQANSLAARELDMQATARLDALQFAPDTGFMSKQGQDAANSLSDYTQQAAQVRTDLLSQIANPAVRAAAGQIIAERTQAAVAAMSRHATTQFQKYQVDTSQSRAELSLQSGARDYANEDTFQANLGTALVEAHNLGALQGWDQATTDLQAQKYQDKAYALRYDNWRAADPVGALGNFMQNANAVSPAVRLQLYHELFQAAAPSLAQQLNASGGVGVVAPPAAAPGQPTRTEPRGVRNNNPGNIQRGPTAWNGEVQGTDPRYASFESPEAGIRAMGILLQSYQDRHGLNTVSDIISRWAPATENDTAAYSLQVAKAMNVQPGAPIDLHDSKTLTGLVKAMIQVENGKQPYTDQQIALGLSSMDGPPPVTAAKATTANAWRDPATPTGNPLVDALPADWKLHVLQLARSQAQQDMAEARSKLDATVRDAAASYMVNGWAPNPPTLSDFVQAYGQGEGPERFNQFQNVARLGQTLQQVKTVPNQALDALVEQSKPMPGPGFAAEQRNYETLVDAAARVKELRQRDPMAYAVTVGAYGLKPLAPSDSSPMSDQIRQRAGVALQLANDYGTVPTLLSKDEAKALSAQLQASPVEQQKGILSAIATGAGNIQMLKATMQAIAPDQPVLALAGVYQARGMRTDQSRDVADLLLRGQAILTPNAKTDGTGHEGGRSLLKMPEDKLLLSEFNSATGNAFAGKEQAADLFMQASRAIYAAKSAEAGDYSGNIDAKRWRAAIDLATGGLHDHNGSTVVMPYGMPYDTFRTRLAAQAPTLAGQALNTQADELKRLPLENVGDGVYLFKRGAGYVVTKDGRPLTVNLNP